MTFAPESLLEARALILFNIPGIDPNSVGISGDGPHTLTGSSYHLGKDQLRPDSYSIVESSRDRNGLSNAASALDIGMFTVKTPKGTFTLRDYSRWLVAQCVAGTPDTADIREVIYSLDGVTVKRWDRLRQRTTGDASHRTHTHKSYFRDSEHRDKTALIRRWFIEIGLLEDGVSKQEVLDGLTEFFAGGKQTDGTPTSRIGRDALSQGIPNPFAAGERTVAYGLLGDLGKAVIALGTQLAGGTAALADAIGRVDDEVLAALADAGHSVEDTAAGLFAALGDPVRARAVAQRIIELAG